MSEARTERLLIEAVGAGRAPAELPRAGVLVVGSDARRAGFVVTATDVADVHCAIGRTKGGGWAIKDLGSSTGTFVNGKRVESARLAAGDEIVLGAARLRIVDPERPSAVAAPKASLSDTQAIDTSAIDADALSKELARTAGAPRASANASASAAASNMNNAPANAPNIAGYRVERRLGRGGMGDVWLAVQESLDRQVALKVLSAKFEADREFVRRFQAEARAAAALNHPNVVTVYDVGEDKGKHYLSMEFMEKGNLEDRVGKGVRLPEREVLDLLRDAASGLVYAEQRGIVHRDLKPANLMLNHVGQTKIADLGLATHVEAEETQTADKKVFGTPHFMSPEQARGERVDHRSDLYSLGATAYRLLTGHTPFEGQNARDIVRSLLRDEPKSMKELAPELSDDVVLFVGRLMKKDAAQRFTSAAEVLREIERLRNPNPVVVSQKSAGEPAKGSKTGLVFVLVLLAAGGGGYYFWKQKQDAAANAARALATSNANNANSNVVVAPNASNAPIDPKLAVAPTNDPANAGGDPATKPTTSTPDKDDKELQLFEANAKVALLELMGKSMPEAERRDALRSLAVQFQGTNAATEANEKADAIASTLISAENAAAAHKIELDALIARMRAAAKLDDRPPHPGTSLLAMRAVDGQQAFAQDPEFIAQRKQIEATVSKLAVIYSEEAMTIVFADLDRGEFDAAKKHLEELMPLFDLPDFSLGEAPSGVSELFEKGRAARERLHTLEASRTALEEKREREDQVAVAAGFGGQSGLEHEIRALDFVAARARLDALTKKLSGTNAQALAQKLAQDCDRSRAAIEALAKECSNGGWRRKSFSDPRDKKSTTRNAIGADATGILYDADGGATAHVPWSAFGGNTREISKLFFERCTREWTPDEMLSIATLIRLNAVVEALEISGKMFDPSRKANFTEGNVKEIQDAFAQAQNWATRAPASQPVFARELEAANLLASVMRQTTEGQWSTAVAGTERLLSSFTDTLLVRLLSSGKAPDTTAPNSSGSGAPGPNSPGQKPSTPGNPPPKTGSKPGGAAPNSNSPTDPPKR